MLLLSLSFLVICLFLMCSIVMFVKSICLLDFVGSEPSGRLLNVGLVCVLLFFYCLMM